MQKIPTIFIRDKDNPKRVTAEVDPDCQWVLDGEGTATLKWDGEACLIRQNVFYRRHRLKEGKFMPPGWLHHSLNPLQMSGHGWAPVSGDTTADQYHWDSWLRDGGPQMEEGTYEIIGPHFGKNPHNMEEDVFAKHGSICFDHLKDRSHLALKQWLEIQGPMEGLVFHHTDGRMAKIKRRDFGLPWPVKEVMR